MVLIFKSFFLFVILFSPFLNAETYSDETTTYILKKQGDYLLSPNCNNCLAKKNLDAIDEQIIKNSENKFSKLQLSSGSRVCKFLGGIYYLVDNRSNQKVSLCLFKNDNSYTLVSEFDRKIIAILN
jgi:hypothetical protein